MKIEIHPSCMLILTLALIAGLILIFPVIQGWLGGGSQIQLAQATQRAVLVTQVAEATIQPGPKGGAQIKTLVPTPKIINSLADVQALRPALQDKTVFSTFHMDAVANVTQSDVAWYCRSLKMANPLNTKQDLFNLPDTTYGSAILVTVDLVGGVLASDLRNLDNIQIQEVDLAPVEEKDGSGNIIRKEYLNGAVVRLKGRFRVLSAGSRAGNQVKATIQDVGSLWKTWIEVEKNVAERLFSSYPVELRNVLVKQRDEVDTLVLEKSTYQAIAPVKPDGSRDLRYLYLLRDKAFEALNSPGQPAYENLLVDVTRQARSVGIKGPISLRVDFIEEKDFLYYDSSPVLPGDLDKRYARSECPDYQIPVDVLSSMKEKLKPLP